MASCRCHSEYHPVPIFIARMMHIRLTVLLYTAPLLHTLPGSPWHIHLHHSLLSTRPSSLVAGSVTGNVRRKILRFCAVGLSPGRAACTYPCLATTLVRSPGHITTGFTLCALAVCHCALRARFCPLMIVSVCLMVVFFPCWELSATVTTLGRPLTFLAPPSPRKSCALLHRLHVNCAVRCGPCCY